MDKQINLELFKQYDKDNDGKISLEEVGDLLKQLGMNIYPASLEKDLNSIIYSNSEEYESE